VRASRAYITSLGTTGVLIASSILLFVVVSTIVAFRGWPGDDIVDGLGSLRVGEDQTAFEITGPAQIAADAAPAAAAVGATPPAGSAAAAAGSTPTAGGPAPDTPAAGGAPTADTTTPGAPQSPGTNQGTGTTSGQQPGVPTPPVSPVTGRVGGTTENLTNNAGQTVGGVNPGLGKTVSDTGKAVSDIVEGLGGSLDTGLGGKAR
jgi:hypothetical protein